MNKLTVLMKSAVLALTGSAASNLFANEVVFNEADINLEELSGISKRMQILKSMDLNGITEQDKNVLIQELLDLNSDLLETVPNLEIHEERYRNEVGSHSFAM